MKVISSDKNTGSPFTNLLFGRIIANPPLNQRI
jgi:hypothetical protein